MNVNTGQAVIMVNSFLKQTVAPWFNFCGDAPFSIGLSIVQ